MFLQILIAFSVMLIKLTSGQSCLDVHNMYRQKHNVPNLQLSQRLEWHATKRAKELASTDIFEHEKNSPYGENLYWKTGRIPSCYDAVSKWYNEIDLYNYNRAGYAKETGHFTQVVWRDTTHVGCASAKSDRTQRIYIVCTYSPAGNFRGEYQDNVPPLQTSSYGNTAYQGYAKDNYQQNNNYNSQYTTSKPTYYNTRKAVNTYYQDNSAYDNNNNVYSSNYAGYYSGNNNNAYRNKQYNYYTKKYTYNTNNNYKYNYNHKYRYQYT